MLPFTLGHVFRGGDVPSGTVVTADNAEIQVVAKNFWRDGSLKFAVISGRSSLTAGVTKRVALAKGGTAPAGANLSLAELKATGISASISYGSYGSVNWSGADWDSPFISWVQGPQMSSWVYRKPIGSDQHLVGWIEIRVYLGGAVEVVPWLENGYLNRAAPGQRDGVATFSLGGTERFSGSIALLNHTRTYLGSGTAFSHWLGTDPGIQVRHDVAYMKATRIVPNYDAPTASISILWTRPVTSFTPLGRHNYPTVIGNAGYHESIGLLPEWDAAYLTGQGDARAWRSIQVNALAAGRYGFHFRDETTQRAVRVSQYPTLLLHGSCGIPHTGASTTDSYTPAASGTVPPSFALSHQPCIAFMSYLLTGRWYFMDEMQLLAATQSLAPTNTGRDNASNLIKSSSATYQTRGSAWALRSLMVAAAMTPDDDATLRAEFKGQIEKNIDFHHARYVAQPTNPLGVVEPSGNYAPSTGRYEQGIWQDDFVTAVWGWLRDLQIQDSAFDAKLAPFLAYKYKAVVGRLAAGAANEYCYRRASQYQLPIAASETPNWTNGTGPWYPNWRTVYDLKALPDDCASSNALVGSGAGQPSEFPYLYWANLLPAIAYAVDHGAAGASAAYSRTVNSLNYAAGAAGFGDVPVWSVKPRI